MNSNYLNYVLYNACVRLSGCVYFFIAKGRISAACCGKWKFFVPSILPRASVARRINISWSSSHKFPLDRDRDHTQDTHSLTKAVTMDTHTSVDPCTSSSSSSFASPGSSSSVATSPTPNHNTARAARIEELDLLSRTLGKDIKKARQSLNVLKNLPDSRKSILTPDQLAALAAFKTKATDFETMKRELSELRRKERKKRYKEKKREERVEGNRKQLSDIQKAHSFALEAIKAAIAVGAGEVRSRDHMSKEGSASEEESDKDVDMKSDASN